MPLPPDWNVPHEWVTARLMWRSYRGGRMAFGFGGWGTDYPGGDRNLIEGVRRLTRIDVRSVEQAVDLDGSDDVYNWPFLYAVEVGAWNLDDAEAKQLRNDAVEILPAAAATSMRTTSGSSRNAARNAIAKA